MMKTTSTRTSLLVAAIGMTVAAFVSGCDRDQQVRSYSTPKETPAAEASAGPMEKADQLPPNGGGAAMDGSAAPADDMRWTLPAGWKQVAVADEPGAFFRPDARLQVDANDPKLVLSVSHLGDAPGARSVVQNVDRWEGQEGVSPTSEADLSKVVKQVSIADGSNADVVDFGGNGKRFLGAIIPHARQTWFLKLPGSETVLAAHKAEFDAFVSSIHFDPSGAAGQQPALGSLSPAPGMNWQVPADWQSQAATMPLLAKFTAANGTVTIKVSSFAAGNFGGLVDNLNRWRGEVDLPPVDAAHAEDVKPMALGHATWKIYDFTSPPTASAKNRVIVGQVESNGNVYFFKMIGPERAVAQQQPTFEKFLGTVVFGS